jgi:hypothetical protein
MSIVNCPRCGEQYLNPSTPGCVECGAPLVGVDLPPRDDEVGYDLDDWDDAQRMTLATQLAELGIAHRWEDLELVIAEESVEPVEAMIDDIDNPDALPIDEPVDDSGVDGGELLSMLYVSSDVLQHNPTNSQAVIDLLEAVDALTEAPPYGLDVEVWRDVVVRASALGDLLGDEASDDDVMTGARELRTAVRPLV